MRILVTDGMDQSAVAALRADGHEVVEQFFPPEELGAALREFDVAVVRSKTKVRKNHIDEAYKKIEKYKETDPELYEKLDMRIRVEGLMPKYLIWKLYSNYYTQAERNAMVDDILQDCDIVCMLTGTHWRPIENAIKK